MEKKRERSLRCCGLLAVALPVFLLGTFQAQASDPVGDETFEGTFNCLKPTGAGDTAPVLCQSQINPGLPSFDFSLVWHDDATTGLRVLDRIDIRRDGESAPFESISGINSKLPKTISNNGFEVLDLNFDGFLDMRVVRAAPSDSSISYQNWLWSNDAGKFVASPGLDGIVSPKFDAEDEEIISRTTTASGGKQMDVYAYDGLTPVLIHREIDIGAAAGCVRTFFDRIEDELRKTGTGTCTEE